MDNILSMKKQDTLGTAGDGSVKMNIEPGDRLQQGGYSIRGDCCCGGTVYGVTGPVQVDETQL